MMNNYYNILSCLNDKNQEYLNEDIQLYNRVYDVLKYQLKSDVVTQYKLGLYPYGRIGKIAESVIKNKFGISELYIYDNNAYKFNDNILHIRSITEIKEPIKLILCSNREDIYCEIRRNAEEYVNIDNIIDVMSPSIYFNKGIYYEDLSIDHEHSEFNRIAALEFASREIYSNQIIGEVAEVGVYKGGFSHYINLFFPDRKIHLFDTFEGFDERDIDENEDIWSSEFRKYAYHKDTSVDIVKSVISYNQAEIHKGWFPDTAKEVENRRFAFVSLDTDLYKPIKAGLEFFWPRLTEGGYIFVDDYGHKLLKGVREAVVEFVKENHVAYIRIFDGSDSTAIIAKPL